MVLDSILIEFYFVDPLRRFHFGHIFGPNENNCVAMGRTNTNTMRCEEIQRKIGTHRLYTDMCLQMVHAHNVPTIFSYEEKNTENSKLAFRVSEHIYTLRTPCFMWYTSVALTVLISIFGGQYQSQIGVQIRRAKQTRVKER